MASAEGIDSIEVESVLSTKNTADTHSSSAMKSTTSQDDGKFLYLDQAEFFVLTQVM